MGGVVCMSQGTGGGSGVTLRECSTKAWVFICRREKLRLRAKSAIYNLFDD